MQKNTVAVLDVGSSKISLIVAERGLNNSVIIKSSSRVNYSGFGNGEFINAEEVPKCLHALVEKAEAEIRSKLTKIYVGVPCDFITSYCKLFKISLNKKRKITEDDIDKLYDAAYKVKDGDYKLIARSAVNFTVDGNRKVSSPKGLVSETLGGMLTFYLANGSFLQLFGSELKGLGIELEYLPTNLAETLYLFESFERDKGGILIDIGYVSSAFTFYLGDGVIYSNNFTLGGGTITFALHEHFKEKLGSKFTFSAAEELKRMINIGYVSFDGACYGFESNGENFEIPVEEANKVVKDELEDISHEISKCIENGASGYKGTLNVYITGGGIAYIRGAKEYLSNRLGVIVKTIAPKLPLMDKPVNSSALSLIDLALKKS